MLAHRLVGPVAITRLDCRNDRLMFVERTRAAPFSRERGGRQKCHRTVHEIELLDKKAVVAGEVDLLVKAPVGPRQSIGIADKFAVGLDHVAQNADLFGGGVARGEAGVQTLKFAPDDIELGHLRMIERGHDQRPPIAGQE